MCVKKLQEMPKPENTSINFVLLLPSPEYNTKAATDYSSQCTANYFF